MFYLILSIIFTSWWALSYKIALGRKCSPTGVITVASGTATSLALLWKLLTVASKFNYLSAIIGGLGGIALFVAIVSYFSLISRGARLGVSWTVIALSMVIPTSFCIFLWKEFPTPFQTLGLVSAVFGICLLGQVKPGKAQLTGKEWGLLSVAFLLSGAASVSSKLIPVLGLQEFKATYVLFLYGGVFIPALGRTWWRKEPLHLKEISVGAGMGIAGIANVFFFLLALDKFTGTLAFPVRTCGNLLLTILVSYLFWHEKLSRKELMGLGLALLAIVFVSM